MNGLAVGRLIDERKNWRKDHPPGFFARPVKNADLSTDIMVWEAGIIGKDGTDWGGGIFRLTMVFPDDYPSQVVGTSYLCIYDDHDHYHHYYYCKSINLSFFISIATKMQICPSSVPSKHFRKSNIITMNVDNVTVCIDKVVDV
jgi:hypothetical protein